MDMHKLLETIELAEKPEEKELVPELNDKFKRWFGDSKVVDDNGQPLVCYHGSTVDIEEFDLSYSGNNTGNNIEQVFYFTSDEDTAITYSQEATVRENEWRFYDEETGFEDWDDYANHLRDEIFENPHINPCYLRIENPYIYDADYSSFDYKKNYTLCSILKGNPQPDMEYWDEDFAMEIMDNFGYYNDEDEWVETGASYDGVIIKNVIDNITSSNQDYIDEYIVWDPYQIKSVYNKGIWDLNNPNVHENIKEFFNEKFEEIEEGIYTTNSAYDVLNRLKNKPSSYRVIYDNNINLYIIGDAFDYIHLDLLEATYRSGFYPLMYSENDMSEYLDGCLEDGSMLLFSYDPEGGSIIDHEKSSDGYTRKYVYDYGTYYCHELTPLEDFQLYKILGEPIKKEDIFENFKSLNKTLERFL